MTTSGATRQGRPREFDEQSVLAAVEAQFHEHGYRATGLRDLTTVSGLGKSSLYGAFGDKRSLFVAVLERYAARRLEMMDEDLREETGTPMERLRRYLQRQAREALVGRGCLLANSATELLPGDDAVSEIVSRQQRQVQQRLAEVIGSAVRCGELTDRIDPVRASTYLFVVIEGMWELGRLAGDAAVLDTVVDAAVRSLN